MSLKILAINGSPRGQSSNTQTMLTSFLKGAASKGAETEIVLLAEKTILPCKGCFACWIKTPGECIQQDDMREILSKIWGCDLLIFASPLYVDCVSGQMKVFMDRMLPGILPTFIEIDGVSRHPLRFESFPKIGVICNSGFPQLEHFQVVHHLFERVALNMHTQVIMEIYRAGGEILRAKSLLVKPLVRKYKKLLEKAGKEVVERGELSQELKEQLEKPIVPPDTYIKNANTYWRKQLAKLERK